MVKSQVIQSFVARIWLEQAAGEDPKWRGHIRHIQGREEAYFQDLTEVCEFLERVSGIPGPGFAPDPAREATTAKHGMDAGAKRKSDK